MQLPRSRSIIQTSGKARLLNGKGQLHEASRLELFRA